MSSKEQMASTEQEKMTEDIVYSEEEKAKNECSSTEIEKIVIEKDNKIAELVKRIAALEQVERDVTLRARAEVENIRRRVEQDVEKAHKFGLEKFAIALLPIIDNLERAVELANNANDNLKPMIEGVELTLKSFLDVAHKFGIETVSGVGSPFNPEVHEAMTMVETTDVEPNHVVMVMQKGYTLNGRLIRPAMVAVAKAVS